MRSWWYIWDTDGSHANGRAQIPPDQYVGHHRACDAGHNGKRSIVDWPAPPTTWVRRRDITVGGPCTNPDCTVCNPVELV